MKVLSGKTNKVWGKHNGERKGVNQGFNFRWSLRLRFKLSFRSYITPENFSCLEALCCAFVFLHHIVLSFRKMCVEGEVKFPGPSGFPSLQEGNSNAQRKSSGSPNERKTEHEGLVYVANKESEGVRVGHQHSVLHLFLLKCSHMIHNLPRIWASLYTLLSAV